MCEDFKDSGPFCRHWGDPSDCNEVCKTCGHKCSEHNVYEGEDTKCNANGCTCKEWKESDSN